MSNKMKLAVYLSFVLFSFSLTTASVFEDGTQFIPLLKRIRTLYAASAVFIVQPKLQPADIDGVLTSHVIHTWCRLLERDNIFSLVITIDEMHALARYYNSIVCPLIVVVIPGEKMFHEFSEKSKSFKMSFASWFVMFIPTPSNDRHDHCYHPQGNPFHLSFDTKMLVMCKEDFTLREWYSVDRKNTEIFELAKWHPNYDSPSAIRLDMFTNLSLYDRRKDLKGTVLRGVAVKTSMLLKVKDVKLSGYFGMILRELENSLNFTIDIVAKENSYGSYNMSTKTWNGAMRLVATGEVDVGVSDFSMTTHRLDYVDFTIPLLITRTNLYLKQSEFFGVKWFAYFKTFSGGVWFCLLLIIIIAHFVLAFIRSRIESRCMKKIMYDEFIRVWSIVCQQGLSEFSKHSSLRVAYFSMSVFALVISASYSAMLICFLASQIRKTSFRSIEEFIRDGSYSMIVTRDSSEYDMFAHSQDSLSVALMKLMKPEDSLPRDIQTGYEDLCKSEKLAFYTSYSTEVQLRTARNIPIPCKVSMINFGRVDNLAMILTKNNQYTAVLNYHLQNILNSGVMNRYMRYMQFHEDSKIEPVGFNSVVSVVMIFLIGVLMAFIILIVEICYYKWKSMQDFN